jgi:hypothetical protein
MFGFVASAIGSVVKANLGGIKRAVGLEPKKQRPAAEESVSRNALDQFRDMLRVEAGKAVDSAAGGAVDAASRRATDSFWKNPQTRNTLIVGGGIGFLLLVLLLVVAFKKR